MHSSGNYGGIPGVMVFLAIVGFVLLIVGAFAIGWWLVSNVVISLR